MFFLLLREPTRNSPFTVTATKIWKFFLYQKKPNKTNSENPKNLSTQLSQKYSKALPKKYKITHAVEKKSFPQIYVSKDLEAVKAVF
ncbi:hypothetical protein GQ457_13G026350 [Hibiscus cannabinus]